MLQFKMSHQCCPAIAAKIGALPPGGAKLTSAGEACSSTRYTDIIWKKLWKVFAARNDADSAAHLSIAATLLQHLNDQRIRAPLKVLFEDKMLS
jgi:hypothetical protein